MAIEGKFSQNKQTDSSGAPVTYNNLSVSELLVIGKADRGRRPDVENAVDTDPGSDEDIPF